MPSASLSWAKDANGNLQPTIYENSYMVKYWEAIKYVKAFLSEGKRCCRSGIFSLVARLSFDNVTPTGMFQFSDRTKKGMDTFKVIFV